MASGLCTSESATEKLDVNALDCDGNTMLHEIVKKVDYINIGGASKFDENHIQYIKLLLKFHPDLNVKNSQGYTPLHLAVRNERSLSVLEALTKDFEHAFIDADSVNERGDAAIHEIFNYTNAEDAVKVLALLMKLKADINKRNSKDETILHVAIANNSSDVFREHQLSQNSSDLVIKAIIDNGANRNAIQIKNSWGYTPLHLALKNQRSLDVLEALTKDIAHEFIDVNSVNKRGDAAIHEIFNYTNAEDAVKVLALLMKLKADINKRNSKDETILYMAITKNSSDLLTKAMIDHGATDVKNYEGYTSLHLALKYQRSLDVLESLTKDTQHALIDIVSVNKEGDAVIHEILNYRNAEDAVKVLALLMKLKADINKRNSKDETILYMAITKNSSDLLTKAMIDHGATDVKNYEGYTSLHLALKNQRSLDVLEALTKDTQHVLIDVNSVNKKGDAVIHEIFNYTNAEDAVKVLALLMKFKVDINKRNSNNETILHVAIAKNSSDLFREHQSSQISSDLVIKAIIDNGANRNAMQMKNSGGYTPLHLALKNQRSLDVLEALTKDIAHEFIDVNSVNKEGDAAIHEIFNYTNAEDAVKVLALLMKLKADINKRNSKDETILYMAIAKKSSDLLTKAIVDHGADLNATDGENGCTLLHLAVKNQRSQDVLESLTKDTQHSLIDVDSVNKKGDAVIHEILNYTNAEGAVKVLALLMKLKADINKRNAKDETILYMAIEKKRPDDLIKAILDHGADINATDNQGRTALYHAVFPTTTSYGVDFSFSFKDVAIFKCLVEKGAKIDMAAKNGYSPLLLAVILKNTDYVKAMLEDVSNLSEGGLEQMANSYCLDVEYCTYTNRHTYHKTALYPSKEYYNMTPLLIAVYDCNKEMAEMLIKAGASVNAVNPDGDNALHVISKEAISGISGNTKMDLSSKKKEQQGQIAKLLIESGINLNARDRLGMMALNYAIRNDKHDIVVCILERGLDNL